MLSNRVRLKILDHIFQNDLIYELILFINDDKIVSGLYDFIIYHDSFKS